jgi:hypothetical protein
MSSDIKRWVPPNDPTAFESFCLDLFKEVWQDPSAQKNGRSGQPQAGVDIFGQCQGERVGTQCKQKDGLLWSKVTVKELKDEVEAAKQFKPPLARFILATTGPRDAKVQQLSRELTEKHKQQGLFSVEVWSWEDIWHEFYRREALFEKVAPIYWPRLAAFHRRRRPPLDRPLLARAGKLFGRDAQLDDLIGWLRRRESTCVWGPAGFGKTALAAEAIHRLLAEVGDDLARSPFPGGIVLLNLYELSDHGQRPWEQLVEQAWHTLADRFDPALPADQPARVRAGRQALVVDEGWQFDFNIGNINNPVFIDPDVAIGYDYFVDFGPYFASVLLPTLGFGDNLYDLWSWNAGLTSWVDSGFDLTGGVPYAFGAGGVDRFRILGIEMPGLDPLDVTAFVTGLWFTDTGTVSMRQVPNVVPLPGAVLLGGIGLSFAGWRLRRKAT